MNQEDSESESESESDSNRVIIQLSDAESDVLSDTSDTPILRKPKVYCRTCQKPGHISKSCYQAELEASKKDKSAARVQKHQSDLFKDAEIDGYELYHTGVSTGRVFRFPHGFADNVQDNNPGEFGRPARISYLTNTYVKMSLDQATKRFKAEIWAAGDDDELAARKLLEQWRDEVVPIGSKSSQKSFGRVKAYDSDIITFKQTESRQEYRQRFTKDVGHDELFSCCFKVPWLVQQMDEDLTPEKVLGPHLRKLDPIRMSHEVFIKIVGPKMLAVAGASELLARKACIRLQIIQFNALAKTVQPCQFYLVKPAHFSDLTPKIVQKNYERLKVQFRPDNLSPIGEIYTNDQNAWKVMEFGNEKMKQGAWKCWHQEYVDTILDNEMSDMPRLRIANTSSTMNSLYAEVWFRKMLQLQPWYIGNIRMRACIGTCAFTKYLNKDELDIGLFQDIFDDANNGDSHLESIFTKELGNTEVEEKLLAHFMDKNIPLIPDALAGEIGENAPHSCAVEFIIDDHELKVSFSNLESAFGIATWNKFMTYDAPFAEINFLDLISPHLSYNLNATWSATLDSKELWKIPPAWSKFPDLIKIDPEKAQDPGFVGLFFEFPEGSGGALPVSCVTQRQIWRFYVSNSDYMVELHRIQQFDCRIGRFGIIEQVPMEVRYGVEVFHPQWERNLSQNLDLKPGQRAKWEAEEYAFFPANSKADPVPGSVWERGSGIKEFLRTMGVVEDIITGAFDEKKAKRAMRGVEEKMKDLIL
jgi:hypothetical protein